MKLSASPLSSSDRFDGPQIGFARPARRGNPVPVADVLREIVFVDDFAHIGADFRRGRDRRTGPGLEAVAEGVKVAVGADARIFMRPPGAAKASPALRARRTSCPAAAWSDDRRCRRRRCRRRRSARRNVLWPGGRKALRTVMFICVFLSRGSSLSYVTSARWTSSTLSNLQGRSPLPRGLQNPVPVKRQRRDSGEAAAAGAAVRPGRPADDADDNGTGWLVLEHRPAGIAGAGAKPSRWAPCPAGSTRRICNVPGLPVAIRAAVRTMPPLLPSPRTVTPMPAMVNLALGDDRKLRRAEHGAFFFCRRFELQQRHVGGGAVRQHRLHDEIADGSRPLSRPAIAAAGRRHIPRSCIRRLPARSAPPSAPASARSGRRSRNCRASRQW